MQKVVPQTMSASLLAWGSISLVTELKAKFICKRKVGLAQFEEELELACWLADRHKQTNKQTTRFSYIQLQITERLYMFFMHWINVFSSET